MEPHSQFMGLDLLPQMDKQSVYHVLCGWCCIGGEENTKLVPLETWNRANPGPEPRSDERREKEPKQIERTTPPECPVAAQGIQQQYYVAADCPHNTVVERFGRQQEHNQAVSEVQPFPEKLQDVDRLVHGCDWFSFFSSVQRPASTARGTRVRLDADVRIYFPLQLKMHLVRLRIAYINHRYVR